MIPLALTVTILVAAHQWLPAALLALLAGLYLRRRWMGRAS